MQFNLIYFYSEISAAAAAAATKKISKPERIACHCEVDGTT